MFLDIAQGGERQEGCATLETGISLPSRVRSSVLRRHTNVLAVASLDTVKADSEGSALRAALHRLDCLVGRPHRVRQKLEVDERGGVSVPPLGMPRGRGRVLRNHGFKPLLQQITEVRFDAHVRQHSTENHLADAALAQLQHEVVRLRTKDPMRTYNDRLAVFNVGLEALEPVGTGAGEPLETQSSSSQEHPGFGLIGLQWAVELPSAVRWEEIVWGDEDLEAIGLCGLEDPLHVLDGVVFRDAPADQTPRKAFLAEHLILRIDEDDRSVVLAYFHPTSPDGLSAPFHYIRSRILQRRSPPYQAESVLLNLSEAYQS